MGGLVKQLLKFLHRIAQAGRPVTDDERMICANWLARRDEGLATAMLYFGIVFHSTSLFVQLPLVQVEFRDPLAITHGLILSLELLWILFLRKQRRVSLKQFLLAMEITALVAFALICRVAYFSTHLTLDEQILASNALVLVLAVLTLVIPFHGRVAAVTMVFYFMVGLLATYDGNSVSPVWTYLITTVMVSSCFLHFAHTKMTRIGALRELRLRTGMAPLQMVRKSVKEEESVESVFSPNLRYCVCISSDWRSFQELTLRLDARSVAEALSAYYQICNEELRDRFPNGNYYSDWIADELFVVLFTDSPLEIMELSRQALELTQAILKRKAQFVIDRDFPFGIDIGMAVGQAMVGIMGPTLHRKATALGEVPGRSRRLQATGKLLRLNLGEKDRIVFDEDFANTLPDGTEIERFSLESDRKLRDLNTRTLYFVELKQNLLDLLSMEAS